MGKEFIFMMKKLGDARWYLLASFIALEFLVSFSFLGYLHVEPISITFAYLPVLAAACLLGPLDSTAVALAFGLASMWKAGASYVSAGDHIFSPSYSGDPLGSILLSIGARMLFGFLAGWMFRLAALAPQRARLPLFAACAAFGKFLHSFCVYAVMQAFFPSFGGVQNTFGGFFTADNLVSMLGSAVLIPLCYAGLYSKKALRFFSRLQKGGEMIERQKYHRVSLAFLVVGVLCFALAVAGYFIQRMAYVVELGGVTLSEEASEDLVHLQIQFLLGLISLSFLVIVFLIFNRRYHSYQYYEASIDPLTSLLNRRNFFSVCGGLLGGGDEACEGCYFFILDVDLFKRINDQYGHPKGDQVLAAIARDLRELFAGGGALGRLGGDEFVAFVSGLERGELESRLSHLLGMVHAIPCGKLRVTASIGVATVGGASSVEELYRRADAALYRAKQQGRDCYAFAEE